MLKWCPNCGDETEVRHGFCSECGEQVYERESKKDAADSDWDEENNYSDTEWDQFYKYEKR